MATAITKQFYKIESYSLAGLKLWFHPRYKCSCINDVLKDKPIGQNSSLQGWVKTIQEHKGVTFFHLVDGSGPHHLQVVLPVSYADTINVRRGSFIKVEGKIVKSPAKGQNIEMFSSNVEMIGPCDTSKYPFNSKQHHAHHYARDYLHVRPKTTLFNRLLRIRNAASMAVHEFFQKDNYMFIHTPILTSSDCEGGSEVFKVEPYALPTDDSGSEEETDYIYSENSSSHHRPTGSEDECNLPKLSDKSKSGFFRGPSYLTVSGQLHLEVITGAFKKVYNFGPAFRAESSRGSFHLSEFYMVEAELGSIQTLEEVLKVMEALVKSIYESVIKSCPEDVELYRKSVASPSSPISIDKIIQSNFARISYTDAIDLLVKSDEDFQFEVSWGNNLMKEHEIYITKAMGGIPVFVTDYPAAIKPFYAKINENPLTVAASDLLVPHVGELCGGSLRENRLDLLTLAMKDKEIEQQLDWYLDLRRFGCCPTGGFGLGFERLLMLMLGAHSLKDVIPFPRWSGRCDL